uniref:Uncharacterized protein n=1 Tax=Cacopsylla melanoneura TaxID=428564 RepID=A0A8D8XFN8_9HEMI
MWHDAKYLSHLCLTKHHILLILYQSRTKFICRSHCLLLFVLKKTDIWYHAINSVIPAFRLPLSRSFPLFPAFRLPLSSSFPLFPAFRLPLSRSFPLFPAFRLPLSSYHDNNNSVIQSFVYLCQVHFHCCLVNAR